MCIATIVVGIRPGVTPIDRNSSGFSVGEGKERVALPLHPTQSRLKRLLQLLLPIIRLNSFESASFCLLYYSSSWADSSEVSQDLGRLPGLTASLPLAIAGAMIVFWGVRKLV